VLRAGFVPPWRWRFAAFNVSFWTAIAFLFAVQASARGAPGPFSRSLATSLTSFAPCALLTPFIAWLAQRYRLLPGERRASLLAHAGGVLAFVIVGGAMMGAFESLLPWGESLPIARAATVAIGRYVAFDVLIYCMVAPAVLPLAYARDAYERSVTTASLEGQLAQARLRALSHQLQPHFLFNTLNAIAALVREDPPQAERLLARLSDLLRQALRDNDTLDTTLEDELTFLEKYLEVQEARFGPRLSVTFHVDPTLLDVEVPRLILQPLVENAILHGVAPRSGSGSVNVEARRAGDDMRLSVRDNGPGIPSSGLREGIGLRTTRARLAQVYGDQHRLEIVNQPEGGASCTLVLPLRRGKNGNGHA